MSYRPGPESGEYTTQLISDGGGTITLNSGIDTLLWTKWPRDKNGYSLVRVQGSISASAVSSPLGEIRMDLPFDQAPGPAADSDALDYFAPCLLFNMISYPNQWGRIFLADTASHQAFGRISGWTATYGGYDTDIADQVQAGTQFTFDGFTYFTDDDTPLP